MKLNKCRQQQSRTKQKASFSSTLKINPRTLTTFFSTQLLLQVVIGSLSCDRPLLAQSIQADTTLEPKTIVTHQGINFSITGGTLDNTQKNLFHSFSKFSIDTGSTADFDPLPSVQNIFARVTGGQVSNINGTLKVPGNVNLVFMNPNGIILGANAKLDISGSFFATTASRILFSNNQTFSAINPESSAQLLTISVPVGIQFPSEQPASMINQGNLSVGQNLTLAAGKLELSGQLKAGGNITLFGMNTVQLRDTATQSFIAEAGKNLYIQSNQKIDIDISNHPNSILTSGQHTLLVSPQDVIGNGHFQTGGNFSVVTPAGKPANLSSPFGAIIQAEGSAILGNYTGASLKIEAGSISANSLSIAAPKKANGSSDPDIANLTNNSSVIIRTIEPKFPIVPTIFSPFTLNNSIPSSTTPIKISEFFYDFEGTIGNEWSQTNTQNGQNNPNNDFLGTFFNNTVSLSFNTLLTHTSFKISLDLLIIGTWNGNGSLADKSPDTWKLSVEGGQTLLDATFSNQNTIASFPSYQSYPGSAGSGTNNPATTGASQKNYLGYNFPPCPLICEPLDSNSQDSLYQLSFEFPHNSSYIQFNFTGANLASTILDELWGLDNVKVELFFQSTSTPAFNLPHTPGSNPITIANAYPPGTIAVGSIMTLGGSISLSAHNAINLNSAVKSQGGDINLESGNSIHLNSAIVNAETGNINVNAVSTNLNHSSAFLTNNINSLDPGKIEIKTVDLNIKDGSAIAATTSGSGPGGDVKVTAFNLLLEGTSFDGFNPSALGTITAGSGNAGDLIVNASTVQIKNGGTMIGTTTPGTTGNGGNIYANADQFFLIGTSANGIIPSSITADTTGNGNAGNIFVNAREFKLSGGAALSSSSFGKGNGGTVQANVSELIEITGVPDHDKIATGIYARSFDTGNAGGLKITTDQLNISTNARISVNSQPQQQGDNSLLSRTNQLLDGLKLISEPNGILILPVDPDKKIEMGMGTGDAGNIEITARNIWMNNQAQITGVTASGKGGNITLQIADLLLMRHASLISTTAGKNGDGGNITIFAPFIVGVPKENSDITANAFLGKGGNITITTYGIYGLKFNPFLTSRSDITVSSEFGVDGIYQINTPGIDPSRGTFNREEPAVENEVRGVCQVGVNQEYGELINTGNGGKPPSPFEAITNNSGWQDLSANQQEVTLILDVKTEHYSEQTYPGLEAQGWYQDSQGNIVLTDNYSQVPSKTSLPVAQRCSDRRLYTSAQ